MEDRHFSLSEVAIGLRVSERTVRRWIKDGKLKAYKPGRDYRIPESAVRALVEESEAAPKAEAPPSLFNNLEERRTPTLRPQIELVSSLADEWEREIAERSAERARESRAVRRTKRVFGDLAWAHEIHRVSTRLTAMFADEIDDETIADEDEMRGMFVALGRMHRIVDRTDPWYADVEASDEAKIATVTDIHDRQRTREVLEQKQREFGA